MELSEYIRNVLNEIVKGISEAQTDTKNTEAVIVPDWKTRDQLVHFDIAISRSGEDSKETGIGVFFPSVALGAKTGKNNSESSHNRIQFSIPVGLPKTDKMQGRNTVSLPAGCVKPPQKYW